MLHDVVAPSVGESISEVTILKWRKKTGEAVKNGEVILEIESDKATVEVIAPADGALTISRNEGETVKIGEVVAKVDDAAKGAVSASAPAASATPKAAPAPAAAPSAPMAAATAHTGASAMPLSPAVRKMVADQNLNPGAIHGTGKGGRITTSDVVAYTSGGASHAATRAPTPSAPASAAPAAPAVPKTPQLIDGPGDRRVKMPRIRQKIAERLVHAQHTSAILTTFNEVDMTAVMKVRDQYKEAFEKKNGLKLSFMSFFTRAVIEALKAHPDMNAFIDGEDIVYHDYIDVGIAVGTDRGLVVPVIRGAQNLSMLQIEQKIAELAGKAKTNKLSIAEMTGGTFTISNGGTYGSLMSTPILSPPQSGILGMHKIQERPVVINGKIEVRPMMYLAVSYDHRLIDGKGAVTFLVDIIKHLQAPEGLGLDSIK